MNHTHFHDDHRMLVPDRAYSYSRRSKTQYRKSVLSYATVGATSLFTTAEDLLKWQHNFTSRTVGNDAVFDVMLTQGQLTSGTTIAYAGGIAHGKHKGQKLISHGGADAGFRSYLCGFPEQQVAIAVVANFSHAVPRRIALDIADVVLPTMDDEPWQPTDTPKSNVTEKADANAPAALTDQERQFCGWYFDPARRLVHVVTESHGRLNVKTGYRRPVALHRLAQMRYRSDSDQATFDLEFHPHVETTLGRATITVAGSAPQTLEQVAPKDSPSDLLTTGAGRYYSSELEAFYDIAVQDDRLILQRRRHQPARLVLRFEDALSSGRNLLRFTRDRHGKVNGFLLSTGRVRNLRFAREPESAP